MCALKKVFNGMSSVMNSNVQGASRGTEHSWGEEHVHEVSSIQMENGLDFLNLEI